MFKFIERPIKKYKLRKERERLEDLYEFKLRELKMTLKIYGAFKEQGLRIDTIDQAFKDSVEEITSDLYRIKNETDPTHLELESF